MKLIKFIASVFAAAVLSACSGSDSFNTAPGVTVEMAQSEITVRESAGMFYLPVKVSGTPDARVQVKVKITPIGNSPALPFEDRNGTWSGNFLLTSDVLNIPADEKTASLEIKVYDDRDENEARTFEVTIASAEGAQIGAVSSTIVTISDNDNTPYGKLQGPWKFHCDSYLNGETTWEVNVTGFDDESPDYEKLLTINGLLGTDSSALDVDFIYDADAEKTYVQIVCPEAIAAYSSSESIWAFIGEVTEDGRVSYGKGTILGEVSEDLQTITFEQDLGIAFLVANNTMTQIRGVYDVINRMYMTRE